MDTVRKKTTNVYNLHLFAINANIRISMNIVKTKMNRLGDVIIV